MQNWTICFDSFESNTVRKFLQSIFLSGEFDNNIDMYMLWLWFERHKEKKCQIRLREEKKAPFPPVYIRYSNFSVVFLFGGSHAFEIFLSFFFALCLYGIGTKLLFALFLYGDTFGFCHLFRLNKPNCAISISGFIPIWRNRSLRNTPLPSGCWAERQTMTRRT